MKTVSKRKAPTTSVENEVKDKDQKIEEDEEKQEKELPLVTRGVDLWHESEQLLNYTSTELRCWLPIWI